MAATVDLVRKHIERTAGRADAELLERFVSALFDKADDEAKKQYPEGWKAPKPYLRITEQPK